MKRPMAEKAVRVFLDSNIILSGLISDKGAPRVILDILCLNLPYINGMTGKYNTIEIERNITKQIPDAISLYRKYFPKLNLEIVPLPSIDEVRKFSGHISDKDVPVIISAINGKADILVTGDKKDFEKLKIMGKYPFKILSPTEFLNEIQHEILKAIE
jgi:predicted nucleic acid-binding protein